MVKVRVRKCHLKYSSEKHKYVFPSLERVGPELNGCSHEVGWRIARYEIVAYQSLWHIGEYHMVVGRS